MKTQNELILQICKPITHDIVHMGIRGFLAFVARKKNWSKLIGNSFETPHCAYSWPLSHN